MRSHIFTVFLIFTAFLSVSCSQRKVSKIEPPVKKAQTNQQQDEQKNQEKQPTQDSQAQDSGEEPKSKPDEESSSLLLMSYNLHSLFDATHDEGKDDYSYLPIEDCKKAKKKKCYDWTQEKYIVKLSQIKKVFELRKEKNGESQYPDLFAVSEIESAKVGKELADFLGYAKSVVSSSRDERGIDVGLLFNESEKLKFIRSIEHHLLDNEEDVKVEKENKKVEYKRVKKTRPILEVEFEWNERPLFIFVNHWPSQYSGTEKRTLAAAKLRKVIQNRKNQKPDAHIIALGDFNTKVVEQQNSEKHPFWDILLGDGLEGVPPRMMDVKLEVMRSGLPVFPGTYNYNDSWQDLDRFFISDNLLDEKGIEVQLDSFEIFAQRELMKMCEVKENYCLKPLLKPRGYNMKIEPGKGDPGYSDHLPIYLRLVAQ